MHINANTSLYTVMGDPVSHSLSPVMHNHAFSHIGYNAVYLACRVRKIGTALDAMRSLNIKGASITIPHKVRVMDFLDEIDPMAAKSGAVNTIVNRDGRLIGFNTDVIGAVRALKEKTDIRDKEIAVLGAGGTARAIGYGILEAGGRIRIYNRSKKRGGKLALKLHSAFSPINDLKTTSCRIIINTTPVGMVPLIEDTLIKKESLEKEMLVMDAVYNPIETRLLKEARKAGCNTINGVSMFVYQGAAQFELWTGHAAPVDIMKKAVVENLKDH